ncbi:MAG: LPS export ABC transporter periplasmic protein LptC [Legionellaceae bacterium]|nr:LPS export ABC transporter periplasmic protein LptC [Legionellaceae bacterium]
MRLARYIAWFIAAMASIACFGWYYVHSMSPIKIKFSKQALSTMIDATISELVVQQFNTEGKLTHYLKTPLMQHIPENNTHLITTPHIIVSENNQTPWEIDAEEATALYGGKQITFNNHVVVQQKKENPMEATMLTTEQITYFPKDKLATTLKEVTLKQANNKMQSTGMTAYLAESRVQFLSNTRGHYEPHKG